MIQNYYIYCEHGQNVYTNSTAPAAIGASGAREGDE